MAERSYPFDAGSGSAIVEDEWRRMARLWRPSGVIGVAGAAALRVTTGTGASLNIAAGDAIVEGFYYYNDAAVALSVPSNIDPKPRTNLVVLRLNPAANAINLAIVEGTPAVTPVAPGPTQVDTGIWEEPLYQFQMPGSGSPQNPTALVDRRWMLAKNGTPRVTDLYDYSSSPSPAITLPTTWLTMLSGTVTPTKDGVAQLEADIHLSAPGAASAVIELNLGGKVRAINWHSAGYAGTDGVSASIKANVAALAPVAWSIRGNRSIQGYAVLSQTQTVTIDLLSA